MTIYYHIGLSKTGSSSIQQFLSKNREQLMKQGILYPEKLGLINHAKITHYGLSDDKLSRHILRKDNASRRELNAFRSKIESGLIEEVAGSECDSVIISHERSSVKLSTEGIEKVKQLLNRLGQPVRIIVYLRRQDYKVASALSTRVKNGSTSVLRADRSERSLRFLNYEEILHKWATVFGRDNMDVRLFENSFFVGGNLLTDFCHSTSIQIVDSMKKPRRENESIDRYTIEFLRLLNQYLPDSKNREKNHLRGNLFQLLARLSGEEKTQLSYEDSRMLMDWVADSNDAVRKQYFPDRTALFSEEFDEEAMGVPELSRDDVVELAAKLWLLKQEDCEALQKELESLRNTRGEAEPVSSRDLSNGGVVSKIRNWFR